jgi:glucose-6-phosphate 1-dehydrogenase
MKNPLREGLDAIDAAEPLVIFIFGVTGDLTRKKLMPALFSLYLNERLSEFKIVGFARREWTKEYFRDQAREMIADVSGASEEQRSRFVTSLDYLQSTFEDPAGYEAMQEYAAGFPNRIYYLSTPPGAYEDVIRNLGEHGLARSNSGYVRIIVEKPFGRDLSSARRLNSLLESYFDESQIYRIDHYLGKETVQNLMMLRFGNGIFEPVWNNRYVDHVQITVAESAGVGTRGDYYERAGALRDMIQNHTFQLLAITAMEPPNDTNPESIRGEKVKVMRSLDPITYREPERHIIRAQYSSGVVDGTEVPGYLEEDGVDPESRTETFTALRLYLDSWRWAGVPFVLRTGKRLSRKVTEISVHFKHPPLQFFGQAGTPLQRNVLSIRIQPQEGITLNVNAKIPGYATAVRPVNMDFAYGSSFGRGVPEAYERLLFDAMKGDNTLYTRKDEIEASWSFINQILDHWAIPPGQQQAARLPQYDAGSAGPDEARSLLADGDRRWRRV